MYICAYCMLNMFFILDKGVYKQQHYFMQLTDGFIVDNLQYSCFTLVPTATQSQPERWRVMVRPGSALSSKCFQCVSLLVSVHILNFPLYYCIFTSYCILIHLLFNTEENEKDSRLYIKTNVLLPPVVVIIKGSHRSWMKMALNVSVI